MEASPSTTDAAPRYRILAKLGEGGMAEVYVGTLDQTPGFHKLLVLKLLRPVLAEEADGLTMFLDEARLAARLNHRNVVQTYEVGQIGDRHAIVMEFLEGASLSKLFRAASAAPAGEGLGLAEYLYILCEALSGLHYAHELNDLDGTPLGLVHRDFTPANLMVTLDGQVKVLDFGVAKTRVNVARTHTGTIKGTVRYIAREVLLGQPSDRRSDVYMAGAVLWQMVTGVRPWGDKEDVAVLAAILEQRLPPVRELNPALPQALEAILLRATDPDPNARYASAHALREALLSFAREHELTCDPDRLASCVRALAGAECEAFRRRVEEQLARNSFLPDVLVGATGLRPSHPEVEGSGSRIRVTGLHARTNARKRKGLKVLTAVGACVVGGALAFLLDRDPSPREREVGEAPRAAAAQGDDAVHKAPMEVEPALAARPPHVASKISLRVSAEPRIAQLYLDGELLPGNPVELTVARDDATHELRAEAPGYAKKLVEVRYDRDAQVTLSLDAERAYKRGRSRREGNTRVGTRERKAKSAREPLRAEDKTTKAPQQPARVIDTVSPFRR